jgi:hypothetical protein
MTEEPDIGALRREVIASARDAGYELDPVFCPHGRATSWTGTAGPGDVLPLAEWCPICNPDAVDLDVQAEQYPTAVWQAATDDAARHDPEPP